MKDDLNYLLIQTPSLKNRALNYGDGCFTTMMSVDGKVELLDLHVNRLLSDSTKLSLFIGDTPVSFNSLKNLIKKSANDAFHKSTSRFQIVKLLIARGDSERGYSPSTTSLPSILPIISDYDLVTKQQMPQQCINVAVAKMVLSSQPLLSGIKHLNRLEQVFAKLELANHVAVDDLLLTESNGLMIELTASNFFYNIDGIWHTPCLTRAGVNGVMRQFILNFLQSRGEVCHVSDQSILELSSIDAAFSCNAITKIVPIASIKSATQMHILETHLSLTLAKQVSDEIKRVSE
jgi:4-amino-4-deoxychorismate lyase